jgi:hypothetical protein
MITSRYRCTTSCLPYRKKPLSHSKAIRLGFTLNQKNKKSEVILRANKNTTFPLSDFAGIKG